MSGVGSILKEVKDGLDDVLMEVQTRLRRRRMGRFEKGNIHEGKVESTGEKGN